MWMLMQAFTIVPIDTAGTGYIENDVVRLAGSTFGGTGANDLDIELRRVGGSGEIK